jgi:hypothetical protein
MIYILLIVQQYTPFSNIYIYIYITNVKTIYDFTNLIEGSKKALCFIEEQDYL